MTSKARRASLALLAAVTLGNVLGVGAPALAQSTDAASGGQDTETRVSATAIVLREEDVAPEVATAVLIASRRALSAVDGVRYVDPVDQMSVHDVPAALSRAADELDVLAAQARTGDPETSERRLTAIVELFEQHLLAVRRSQLVDAYMLLAVASCRANHVRRCTAGFERVLVFREESEYDEARYPIELRTYFDDARAQLQSQPRVPLTVTTEPVGAEVFVDGRSIGASPARATELLPGDHYITVKLLGYEKAIQRVTVDPAGDSSVSIVLDPSRDRLLIEQTFASLPGQLGQDRIPAALLSLATSRLFANQLLVAHLQSGSGLDRVADFFVYDCRSRFLLGHRRITLAHGAESGEEVEQAVTTLYATVDLGGTIAAPPDQVIVEPAPPIWQRWWFWTAIGVVVASGVTAAVLLDQPSSVPDGFTRLRGQLP